jgi:hypothetical protein
MVSHFVSRLTLNPFYEKSQKVYEMHCDEVQKFLGIFQQIAPALTRACCLLERRVQQEKHVAQLKEQ